MTPHIHTIARLVLAICLLGGYPSILTAQVHTPRYYVSRAEDYANNKAWNEAKREVDNGLADYPDDPNLLYLNGRYYYVTGHLNEARYNLVKAIQIDDQNFKAKRILVDVEDDTKHYSSAICYINELLEYQPYDRDLWRRKIGLYRKLGNNNEADATLERLARIYPNDTIVRNDLRRRHQAQMTSALQKNNLEEMAIQMEQWIDLDPHHLDYYLELIGIYQRMGEFDRAIGTANRGLEYFPKNKQLTDKTVGILTDQGLYTQALEIAKTVYPPHATPYRYLLQQVATNTRLNDPYEVHGKLYNETHDRDALNYLINTSLTRGYNDDARQFIAEAIRLDGRTPQLLMKLYALEKRTGNTNECLKLLRELYNKQPANEELKAEYADLMVRLSNTDMEYEQWSDAAEHLQKALELMDTHDEAWPATMSKSITVAGKLAQFDHARTLYQNAATTDPGNRQRYASAYEDIMATRFKQLIEDENYDQLLREGQELLKVLPTSEIALRNCINASQTLRRNELFYDFAHRGYEAFPEQPYFRIKQAVALQQQGRNADALTIVRPTTADDTYANPQLTAAFAGISNEWASELLKNKMPDVALAVIDSALLHDANNRELLYARGLAYEQKKEYDKAYLHQKHYYEPSNAEQKEYYQHMRYLRFRSLKNHIDASYTHAAFDTRTDGIASRGHLYSVAAVAYGRLEKDNTYTGQISYKGIDGYHDEETAEAGGVGIELTGQWEHTFNQRWSGSVSASWSNRFFNKAGANIGANYATDNGWTPSMRLGYRHTPETYLFLGDNSGRAYKQYDLLIATPALEKSWERITASAKIDLTLMESSIYYNVGLKGMLLIGDDNTTSVALQTGFGSFPELTFFEQTALRGVSHTNAMVGFNAKYLCAENMYIGLTGNWNTCFNPYYTEEGILKDAYRNIYSVTLQLHVAF